MQHEPCEEVPQLGLMTGIQEFNRGEFFECHDTLEALWMDEARPIRQLYQGILQVGVAFYHLRANRYRPVVTLLTRGCSYLRPFAPTCMGVDIQRLMADIESCLDHVERLGPSQLGQFDWRLVPKIQTTSRRAENA